MGQSEVKIPLECNFTSQHLSRSIPKYRNHNLILPEDVLIQISVYMDTVTVVRLTRTCKSWRRILIGPIEEKIFKRHVESFFGEWAEHEITEKILGVKQKNVNLYNEWFTVLESVIKRELRNDTNNYLPTQEEVQTITSAKHVNQWAQTKCLPLDVILYDSTSENDFKWTKIYSKDINTSTNNNNTKDINTSTNNNTKDINSSTNNNTKDINTSTNNNNTKDINTSTKDINTSNNNTKDINTSTNNNNNTMDINTSTNNNTKDIDTYTNNNNTNPLLFFKSSELIYPIDLPPPIHEGLIRDCKTTTWKERYKLNFQLYTLRSDNTHKIILLLFTLAQFTKFTPTVGLWNPDLYFKFYYKDLELIIVDSEIPMGQRRKVYFIFTQKSILLFNVEGKIKGLSGFSRNMEINVSDLLRLFRNNILIWDSEKGIEFSVVGLLDFLYTNFYQKMLKKNKIKIK